jgi:polyhydroxybutyrate depolymerase
VGSLFLRCITAFGAVLMLSSAQAFTFTVASVYVPQVTGAALPDAERDLRYFGLTVGTVTNEYNAGAIAGEVIGQNPVSCSNCAPSGSPVDLIVSLGAEHVPTTDDRMQAMISVINSLGLQWWERYWLTYGLNLAAPVWTACQSGDYSPFDSTSIAYGIDSFCADDKGKSFASSILEHFLVVLDFARGNSIYPYAFLTGTQADMLQQMAQDALDDLLWVPRASLQTLVSGGVERDYYLIVPDNYSQFDEPLPIIFLAHGTNGTWANWLEVGGFYGTHMIEAVGADAIIGLLQADVISTGIFQWDREIDSDYFEDVLGDVSGIVNIDADRVFVHGHSSGGGYTHEVGCRLGDKVRGIAPSAGSLILFSCTGSTAVLQTQSQYDNVVPQTLVEPGVDIWALYNGFEKDIFTTGPESYCRDHSQGSGADYPVIYCLHDETANNGHRWWGPQGELIWNFFTGLSDVPESIEPPPGGGNGKIVAGLGSTANFSLNFPDEIGDVYRLALVLYPAGTQQPIYNAPLFFLNTSIDPLGATAGSTVTYSVPISLPDAFPYPYDFTATVSAYVVGGAYPQGTPGLDFIALQEITLENATDPIVIDGIWELVPLQ